MGRKVGVSADAKLQIQAMKSGTRKEARLMESDNGQLDEGMNEYWMMLRASHLGLCV